ncbi:MAG TPA: lyase family protein, partial [Fimbriimonadaceae bacterium]|nr:lyase family protein [Fimbriimonadaceae bacterium]
MKQKLWGGAFAEGPDELAWSFGQSIESDIALWREEIAVSIAHAEMLGATGIIPDSDAKAIVEGLRAIRREAEENGPGLVFPPDAEDIHAAIESLLKKKVGDAADKLHAGRSRNDQIATVTRLWLRHISDQLVAKIVRLQRAILDIGEKHKADPMPGFTHMQSAQPLTLGFHLMAHYWMLQRDVIRFKQVAANANVSPLGSAALAGTSLPIDRQLTAKELGFASPMS